MLWLYRNMSLYNLLRYVLVLFTESSRPAGGGDSTCLVAALKAEKKILLLTGKTEKNPEKSVYYPSKAQMRQSSLLKRYVTQNKSHLYLISRLK